MNQATFIARLAKKGIITKTEKINRRYSWPVSHLLLLAEDKGEGRIYTKTWKRSRGAYSLEDNTDRYTWVLSALGIKFETDNTAPKGGAEGFCLVVKSSELRKIRGCKAS